MKFSSPRQLKDWIKNYSKKNNVISNTILQNYMMERLLERMSLSPYHDNFILKGGFLITSLVGSDLRSTLDIDTTIKGLPVTRENIEKIIQEVLAIAIDDNVSFQLIEIKNIRDTGEYDDFRASLVAHFFNMSISMKLDITTGDEIIPREIEYGFKLMFEDRSINIKAYNIETILSEKIESILSRNVANTRSRDYYDVYLLSTLRNMDYNLLDVQDAIRKKAIERGTEAYVDNWKKYLSDIEESTDLRQLWYLYCKKYPYANGLNFNLVVESIRKLLE
ncbi:nucleotidyl transferase AbiEii/AbiGii toxin family protein [Acidaminobacter hydrogenoformans]|uniref:Predicted nucleotidyltransferase component of viral defense system n=1 Tax=Acidaminobacter hydrogenoformans DSM 2784 TaxID=1120920 RepID=A0A1G5RYL5_9FIRM|nr:nucleotidyl transferase AbiEii/AbiGii toxin family protein [Acidaminobacter hydrogenoformans]SCZ79027.1 Predicted nucleotidyltransferase component of viral defense system [Acidaminobacter hydrogenoformans DSM 2784]